MQDFSFLFSVLQLPLCHLPGHMDKIGNLANQCNNFFSNLQIKVNVFCYVAKALTCHLCGPGSNPGQGMWQDSGHSSKLSGFPRVLWFPQPHLTT